MNASWIRRRESGIKFPLGTANNLAKSFYTSFKNATYYDSESFCYGGVFNLEFSPDGTMLAAACEKKSVLIFDPLSRKLVHTIENAHTGCVNCVRFLDRRMFATCSDDNSVALWDSRNLKNRIRSLNGHNNWVKNIEFSPRDGLLVTSGFDGCIFTWDINSSTEQGFLYNRVFQTNGLMRMKLSPDASKMLICTTSGYLIVIHNLNLNTIAQDLAGFKPNMYRLMQINERPIPIASNFTHLFATRRNVNRVEFISDFPDNDFAEVVSSLQIHPQGWCAVSRNISRDEVTEWTCVHDIQEIAELSRREETEDEDYDSDKESDESKDNKEEPVNNHSSPQQPLPPREWPPTPAPLSSDSNEENPPPRRRIIFHRRPRVLPGRDRRPRRHTIGETSSNGSPASSTPSTPGGNNGAPADPLPSSSPSATSSPRPQSPNNIQLHFSSIDIWEALVALRDASARRGSLRRRLLEEDEFGSVRTRDARYRIFGHRAGNQEDQGKAYGCRLSSLVHQNVPRLTHYIEEPNVGKGYIKELCFSPDGRIICSPFGFGIRLLSFTPDCEELSTCAPVPTANGITTKPRILHELANYSSHIHSVVSTKFSPHHHLLVSGCLGGRIVWHEPCL